MLSGVYFNNNEILYNNGQNIVKICDKSDIKLIGMHNIANVCAALSAVVDLVDINTVKKVLNTFYGVEHRMEFVRNVSGVNYYNDSIASSPTRTIAGLVSFDKKVILIAGGYDKHIPYDPIGGYILDKVKLLILVGDTSSKIREAVIKEAKNRKENLDEILEIKEFSNLKDCVMYAKSKAKDGDDIVMSPASASFDMYKDFEQRGNYFKEIVKEL